MAIRSGSMQREIPRGATYIDSEGPGKAMPLIPLGNDLAEADTLSAGEWANTDITQSYYSG